MIIKTPVTTNYFSAPNHIAQDNTLSDRAARILTYAASLPANWRIIPKQLMKYFNWGRDSTYKALRELCVKGYAILKRGKQFAEWIIYTTPQAPEILQATSGAAPKNPDFKNSSQTDALQSNKDLQKTEITTTAFGTVQITDASPAPATPIVVVENDLIDQQATTTRDPLPTPTKAVDDAQQAIAGIESKHQITARRALSRLTEEQAQMVLVAFSLQCSKTTIANKTGYLIALVQSALNGSFSPVAAPQAAPAMTAGERIARERQRQQEAAERGAMSNTEYFEWLRKNFGAKAETIAKPTGGRVGLRRALAGE